MLSKKVIAKCLKDAVLECHSKNCKDCKYYKDKTWCLVRVQTDKIYKTVEAETKRLLRNTEIIFIKIEV